VKIICVGRNYREHAAELKNEVPNEPVLFLKPETAIIPKRNPFFIPDFSNNVHYEVELVILICKLGKNIQEKFAHKYYQEATIGIDFTARDLQQHLKSKGLPWEKSKAFDGSAAIGKFIPVNKSQISKGISFHLLKDGQLVQSGNSNDMIYGIDKLISYISGFFTLKIGDLIFTGTPAGVGKVTPNNKLEAFIEDLKLLDLNVK